MNQRLKITTLLFGLLLLAGVGYWASSRQHTSNADESLNLKDLLNTRPAAASACYTNDEDNCFPVIGEKTGTGKAKGHLVSMVQSVARACLSDPNPPYTVINPRVIPPNGYSQGEGSWTCAVDSVSKPANIKNGESFTLNLTVKLSQLPSSNKKTVYNERNQASLAGEQSTGKQEFEVEGQAEAKLVATVAVYGTGPIIQGIDWQPTPSGAEPLSVFKGSIRVNASYSADTSKYLNDPHAESCDHTSTKCEKTISNNNATNLGFGFGFDDKIGSDGKLQSNTTPTTINFCQSQCSYTYNKDEIEDYIFDDTPKNERFKDVTGKAKSELHLAATANGNGGGELTTGKIYWSANSGNYQGKEANSLGLQKAESDTPARQWTYDPGTLKTDGTDDFVAEQYKQHALFDEKLIYNSKDPLPNQQNPREKVYDSGSVVTHIEANTLNGQSTIDGYATRSNPLGTIAAQGVCYSNSDGFLITARAEFKVVSGPIAKGQCIQPFKALQGLAFPDLEEKYFTPYPDPVSRIMNYLTNPFYGRDDNGNPDGSNRNRTDIKSHYYVRSFHALPQIITVIFTDNKQTAQQRSAVINLIHGQARALGALVQIVPAKDTSTALGIIKTVESIQDNSWLLVIGSNPAGLKRSGITIPEWKINNTLEAKSIKMNVITNGACSGGYSNLAESFLPLGQDQKGPVSEIDTGYITIFNWTEKAKGIWTNNFEYAADDLAHIVGEKIFGCPAR